MPGLVPGIRVFLALQKGKTWMARKSPAMTRVHSDRWIVSTR